MKEEHIAILCFFLAIIIAAGLIVEEISIGEGLIALILTIMLGLIGHDPFKE